MLSCLYSLLALSSSVVSNKEQKLSLKLHEDRRMEQGGRPSLNTNESILKSFRKLDSMAMRYLRS
jgi:hypothetical protein